MDEGTLDPVLAQPRRVRMTQIARWDVAGSRGDHQLELITEIAGPGKLEAWLDGRFVAATRRPVAQNPWTLLDLGAIDGRELSLYVETRDGGANVGCDLFVNWVSTASGQPISAVRKRAASVEAYQNTWLHGDHGRLRTAARACLVAVTILFVMAVVFASYVLANWPE